MIALQKPVRSATGGEPEGSPLFYIRGICYKTDRLPLYKSFTEEIQANLDKYTVKQMCSALKFSRSTYYAVMGGDNNDHFRRNTNGKRINRVNDVVSFALQTKEQRESSGRR